MKRLLLALCLVLSCAVSFAGPLKGEGDTKCLKESAKAVLSIDFSKATWEKKEDFKTWCGDTFSERETASVTNFTTAFNESSKGLQVATEGNDAKYKMVIEVKNFERKSASIGFGRAHIKIYGTLKVVDAASGETVCTYTIDGLSGGDDYVETERFAKSFAKLGKELTK